MLIDHEVGFDWVVVTKAIIFPRVANRYHR